MLHPKWSFCHYVPSLVFTVTIMLWWSKCNRFCMFYIQSVSSSMKLENIKHKACWNESSKLYNLGLLVLFILIYRSQVLMPKPYATDLSYF